MSKLILIPAMSEGTLRATYSEAFKNATELYILSAYLTSWDKSWKLNPDCRYFRMIIGRDYGITRKAACNDVLKWLPKSKAHCFKVAAGIGGFHPKAVFWKDKLGKAHALVGSSNLTDAAFESNHEANSKHSLTDEEFDQVKKWIAQIQRKCVPVGGGWLDTYKEAELRGNANGKKYDADKFLELLKLPHPRGSAKQLKLRREQMANFKKHRVGLETLIRECARGRVPSIRFYDNLPNFWSGDLRNRFQGAGFERKGRSANFKELCRSLVRIVDAAPEDRDDIVVEELDFLAARKNPARKAFLSEMLCQFFPELYPVVNEPVEAFLSSIRFRAPRGASEGAGYVNLADRLRVTLKSDKQYPATNLAELDAVIWLKFGKLKPQKN